MSPVRWSIRRVAETASTNTDVAAAARAGEPEGLVLVAERQTGGRGRLGRPWVAPPGGALTFSVLLRPAPPGDRWAWLPLLTGLAVVTAARAESGLDLALKWPNDVLVDDRKLAGILSERAGDAVVVGVGLNVAAAPDGVPGATSLAQEAAVVDRDALLDAVLRDLAGAYGRWSAAGGDADAAGLREAYAGACATLGRAVRVDLPGGRVASGVAESVDAAGRLVVAGVPLAAGDVVHVRRAGPARGGP